MQGLVDPEALRRALQACVRRHEPLRTRFSMVDGEPRQVVQDLARFELPLEDLRHLSPDARAEQVLRRSERETERAFDLTTDVLLRAVLLRLDDHEHVLLLTMHHIASDGWSISVLWRELGLHYDACCRGIDLELPPLPVRYADYAAWQRRELENTRVGRLVDYWRGHLQGSTALELPGDRPRPTVPTYLGSRRRFEINEDLLGQLKALSQRENVTLQMTLLAAFQTLLMRYTGQHDLSIGVPTAGRSHQALENLVGYFVNILVLRTDASGDPAFLELLQRVRAVSLAAYDHQDLPFEMLVERLQPQRHASRSPLVQALFQLLSFPNPDLSLPGLEVSRVPLTHQRVRFDMEMHLWQQDRNIRGMLVYSTDLFDGSSIDRMLGHFISLLSAIVAEPDHRISELSMLTAAERHDLLVARNNTLLEFPDDRCVHELFEAQAAHTPDATALVSGAERWSYRDVDRRANRLAHHLRRHGVVTGTFVGLAIERSVELVVGALAILKAGGSYVPLDVDLPRLRLDGMVLDAGIRVIVTRRQFLDRLPATSAGTICLDDAAVASEGDEAAGPDIAAAPGTVAYVMFTSGSTGRPKGVAVPHRAIVRLVCGQNYATFGPDRVFVQLAPASFDASTFEIWGALLHGATLILAPPGVPEPRELAALLAWHRVTTLWLTASLFNQLIDDAPEVLAGVSEVLTGGEALSVRHIRRAQQVLGPRVQLVNGYGPTEGTTFTTCYRIPANLPPDLDSIPIGRPIANTQVYVLDARREPVPIGVPGELYIGGPGLADGYLGLPALTAERFVAHPFSDAPDARLYRTGDRCRWRADGELEFLGRFDDQIKLRGFRIELGEVEAALRLHPAVAHCAAVVRDFGEGDKRLIAFVVPAGQSSVVASELRDHLRSRLPEHMLPAMFVPLEDIPLTPSGKIDRAGLASYAVGLDDRADVIEPRTPAERTLVAMWCELLACDRVSIHDDFFAMGGHSLLAVRLFARIEKEFGCRLPMAVLFQQGTIAHLARLVEEERQPEPIARAMPLQTSASGRPLFMMPTIVGEAIFAPTLIQKVGARFPVVGIQPAFVPKHLEHFREFRDTAAHFVAAMRAYQPRGPYAVVGFSYGGLMAFEVASILHEAGEEVDLLAVIDTGPNHQGLAPSYRARLRRLSRVAVNFPSWLREEASDLSVRRLFGSVVRTVRRSYRSKVLGKRMELDDVFDVDHMHTQHLALMRTVFAAVRDYAPRQYPGTLTLIRATAGPLLQGFEPDLGWRRFAKAVEIHHIKGNHETILRPPRVGELADHLVRLLDRRSADRR
jgi:amino acid adenylation domain-containing protein